MKRRKKQGCGQRAQEVGKGSSGHHFIYLFICLFIGYLIMDTIFSMDKTYCDYNFSQFSGVLLGLQLIPPSLRRQIWERINSLISFLGWEYPVIEVSVLKKSIFTILSNKFQRQWPPEYKIFLLSRFSRDTDKRQMEGKSSVCTMGRPGEDFLDPAHVLFLHFYLSWILVENRLKVPENVWLDIKTE